ncbi:MAG: hypothetical protein ABI419_02025 [Ginsengibacter sp.]
MNYNIEKNKSKKNRVRKKNTHSVYASISVNEKNIDAAERRLKDGGFIAWPEARASKKVESQDVEIIEGRSKKGGFIAFPKF